MKNRISIVILGIMFATILVVASTGIVSGQSDPIEQDIQEQIDTLMADYNKALEYELAYGETAVEVDELGEKTTILVGQSSEKIENLWLETVRKMNDLKARTVEEREPAVARIQTIEPGQKVTYLDQDISPYDRSSKLERYQTDKYYYWVDISTTQVVQIDLADGHSWGSELMYTETQLEEKAREFIARVAGDVTLSDLTPRFGDKSGENFFFRWEDKKQKIDGEMPAFIQVGFSREGDLIGYVNTFPLFKDTETTITTTFNEVYANGGNYWIWRFGSYETEPYAGYCYIYGGEWCSPKNFFWTNTTQGPATAKGVWAPNTNPTVKVAAFIPSTHATTIQACYTLKYNGGSTLYNRCISQNDYYDTWVVISLISLNNITKVQLFNSTDGSANREVAWDEIWVYTP